MSTLTRRTRKWVGTANPGSRGASLRPSCERLGAGTPAAEWAQLGASAGRDRHGRGRPRNSVGVPRGALALRGCGLGLASDLEWSCRTTLAHVLAALLSYAINLATRSTELRFSGRADPSSPSPSCSMQWKDGRSSCRGTRDGPPDARGTHDPTHATSSSSSPQRSGRSRRVHSRRYAPRRPRRVAPCTRSCRVRRSRADRRWSPPRTR